MLVWTCLVVAGLLSYCYGYQGSQNWSNNPCSAFEARKSQGTLTCLPSLVLGEIMLGFNMVAWDEEGIMLGYGSSRVYFGITGSIFVKLPISLLI